jgi:hypothetical protein
MLILILRLKHKKETYMKYKFWFFICLACILIGFSSIYTKVTSKGISAKTANQLIQPQEVNSAEVKLISKENLNNWNITLMPDRDFNAVFTGSGKVTTLTLHMDGIKVSGTGTGTPSPSIHVKGSGKLPAQNETVVIELEWIEDGRQINGKTTYLIIAH